MASLIRYLSDCRNIIPRGAILSMGSFSTMHLGHQLLMKKLITEAQNCKKPSIILLLDKAVNAFDESYLCKGLLSWREKFSILQEAGVDFVIMPRDKLAYLPAATIIDQILTNKIGISKLITGSSLTFGADNLGNVRLFRQKNRFIVKILPNKLDDFGNCLRNSTVYAALRAGNFVYVKKALNRNWFIDGKVVHGEKRGRKLGFPTANIVLNSFLQSPLRGVYVVEVIFLSQKLNNNNRISNKQNQYQLQTGNKLIVREYEDSYKDRKRPINYIKYKAVANIGFRPTVGGKKYLLEVHLLDISPDIYGARIRVEFLHKLRGEEKFSSLVELKKQISQDVASAREYFR